MGDRIQKYPPSLDEFDILILGLAVNKYCPYTPDALWVMTWPELTKIKEWVHIQDALEYSRQKDSMAKK